MKKNKSKKYIAIVGLGYVGLPLAVEFAKKYKTIGFDINSKRINELKRLYDTTDEISATQLKQVLIKNEKINETGLILTDNISEIKDANFYIITVPTPTDKHKNPDLTPLLKASQSISKILSKGDYVIYESTVYPGVTEEKCVPVLEKYSNLIYNKDFFVGYSPERINPGDRNRPITNIVKVTSGSNKKAAEVVDKLYKTIISAGTYKAESLRVAEASKVIENSQRDINIAFVNELAKICNVLDLDTHQVLEAASTKWNFLPYKPGLVGGHCIGVDPYYIAQKAQDSGYYPELILASRRLNDSMGIFVANDLVKKMIKNDIKVKESQVLILGFTFKENCPDYRNTKIIDVINQLSDFGITTNVYDPHIDIFNVKKDYPSVNFIESIKLKYNAILLAVAHNEFLTLDFEKIKSNNKSFIYDVKGFLKEKADARL